MTATVARAAPTQRRRHLWVAAVGGASLLLCAPIARNGRVGPLERSVFHAINDLPQWLHRPLWLFQQLGNIVVAFAVALVLAVALRRWKLAVCGALAVVAKLGLERIIKQVIERRRPGSTIDDIVSRDAPLRGLSFVSGHAIITAALATLVTPLLKGRWKALPWVVVALNGIGRIYVGAHNPLDIVGGVGVGLLIGGILNAAFAPDA